MLDVETARFGARTAKPVPWWGWVCTLAGLGALAWVPFSLLPGPFPAWPSVSLGLAAWAASRMPGPVGMRALGTVSGTLGLLVGTAQIALLWSFAGALTWGVP